MAILTVHLPNFTVPMKAAFELLYTNPKSIPDNFTYITSETKMKSLFKGKGKGKAVYKRNACS